MPESNMAAPQLAAVEVHGMTRSSFILKGALAAGAVYGVSTVAPFVSEALAQSGGGDVDILNFALTLEYLETEFYRKAPSSLPGEARMLAKRFGAEEAEHVSALTATIKKLGGTPAKKPTFSFPSSGFLKLAQTLEDTGVGAYNGAGPAIQSKEVLGAAGSIVQIEARHAATIRSLNMAQPAPEAFDKAIPMAKVLTAVKPFIKA